MSYSSGYPFCPPGQVFDVSQTWLAGMTTQQLTVLLGQMVTAQAQLMSGGKPVSVSYGQDNGSKSVTYNMASYAQLLSNISMVQKALGMPGMSRRPMHPVYLR